ncbi:putative bifunctional diguanylate cyclase/phosphodiesterase [Kineococcus sp. SYSU DK006]|uniref:putative bifunctional diguanylate cyclase/phosphodiesterase n=1 Tax=Kineococcus sp. SYSU DK006 TaxID=3383127 RepID=UPI003D7ED89B
MIQIPVTARPATRGALVGTLSVGLVALVATAAAPAVDARLLGAVLLAAAVAGTLQLHRRVRDRAVAPRAWRSFTAAAATLLLAAAADLALSLVPAPHALAGVPTAAAMLLAGPFVFHGTVRWNTACRHVLDGGHALSCAGAVLALTAAGNAALERWSPAFTGWSPWQVQGWLLVVSVLVVLTGTAVVTAFVGGARGDARLWCLAGVLAGLSAAAAAVAADGSAGVVGLRAACAAAVVVTGAAVARSCPPVPAVVGAVVPAAGTLSVLGVALLVVVLAALRPGSGVRPAVLWSLAGLAVSAVLLVRLVRRLSELAQARVQARTDELTGAANRRSLVAGIAALPARRPAALLLADVDDFGAVNERLGHHGGDLVLREVAAALRAVLPADGELARVSGDTFALLLPDTGEAAALELAERLAPAVAAVPVASRAGRPLSVSVGVASAPGGTVGADELLRRADTALARARGTRCGTSRYDAQLDAATRERAVLLADLRAALADPARLADELVLHYQPQVHARTGRVVGAEALVRWQHPQRGVLAPAAFLGLAEEHGLMDDLTVHLLHRAAAQAAAWSAAGTPLRVSVNLSAGSLAHPRLLPIVDDVLRRTGLPAQQLVLEITETTLMRDPDLAVSVAHSLVARGVGLSIDDYGTGYSSLAYLTDLPAGELKLDRAFTARVTSEERTAAIVQATVALAHRLGMRVVAEGVEDGEALQVLRHLGADETQGYLHSRPLPPRQLQRWLATAAATAAPSPAQPAPGHARPPAPRAAAPVGEEPVQAP